MPGLARAEIEKEIAAIKGDLEREIGAIVRRQSELLISAVNAAERKMLSLRAYLQALEASRAPETRRASAISLLMQCLATAEHPVSRQDLDAAIVASGLSMHSARKARQTAEAHGLAVRTGSSWSLSPVGRAKFAGNKMDP